VSSCLGLICIKELIVATTYPRKCDKTQRARAAARRPTKATFGTPVARGAAPGVFDRAELDELDEFNEPDDDEEERVVLGPVVTVAVVPPPVSVEPPTTEVTTVAPPSPPVIVVTDTSAVPVPVDTEALGTTTVLVATLAHLSSPGVSQVLPRSLDTMIVWMVAVWVRPPQRSSPGVSQPRVTVARVPLMVAVVTWPSSPPRAATRLARERRAKVVILMVGEKLRCLKS
jgi:hypothetical protein